jgi:archaellum component FlaC
MTKSEYQELVEFIAPRFDDIGRRFDAIDEGFDLVDVRFDAMDKRFDAMDKRFDAMDERFDAMDRRIEGIDQRLARVEILGEENRHHIQIVAEAVSNTVSNDRFEAFRSEVATSFQDLRELLGASHRELDGRLVKVEERLDRRAN